MRPHSTTIGISAETFAQLVEKIVAYEREHRRQQVFRRPPTVPVRTAVLIALLATRQNPVQTFLAAIFGVSQSTISRVLAWGRRLMPELLEPVLVTVDDVPAGETLLADGTLVSTGNRAAHKDLYSGKHHRSGVNLQVVADRWGRLVDVAGPLPGSTHDARAWRELALPEQLTGRTVLADRDYVGCSDDDHACTVRTPTKKPPGRELSWTQQVSNYAHNAARSQVERTIAQLKKWKVLATGYRGPLERLSWTVRTAVALEKLRTHPWPL